MREQFDWCEDVENDIAMKDKSIAMDTDVPTVDTENLAVSSTDYATAIELDGEYPQFPVDHYCLENSKDDVASTCSATDDSWVDLPRPETFELVDTTTTGPVIAVDLGDSHTHLPHPDEFDLVVDDYENDLDMDVEDPAIDIGLREPMSKYEYRSIVLSHDENIRHWNWFGCPGYIGNGNFENGPPISRYELWQRAELAAARQGPVHFPRKLTWKPTPSKLRIQSMPIIDNSPSEPTHPRTYSFVPLEAASKITQKTWLAAKRIPHASISLPAAIMGTMIKKAWCRPKTNPDSTSGSRISIMGRPIKRAWATITFILQKSFGSPLGKVKAGIKKAWHLMNAVFTLHRLVPDVLSWLSF
ncbi:unnamed protein product [Penicillium nalgiovense]|nr:unnamed protein product [Penicillium nalgiovense]